jgi:hypothetical protein
VATGGFAARLCDDWLGAARVDPVTLRVDPVTLNASRTWVFLNLLQFDRAV